MAESNPNALALQVAQPNVDIAGPMKTLAETQSAQANAALHMTQARYQMMRQNALAVAYDRKMKGDQKWFDGLAAIDPEAAKSMQAYDYTEQEHAAGAAYGKAKNAGQQGEAERAVSAYPDIAKKMADTEHVYGEVGMNKVKLAAEQMGRSSNTFLDAVDRFNSGEITREQLAAVWNRESTAMAKHGAFGGMDPIRFNMLHDLSGKDALKMAVDMARQGQAWSQGVENYWQVKGRVAKEEAEAKLPAEKAQIKARGEQERETNYTKPELIRENAGITTMKRIDDAQKAIQDGVQPDRPNQPLPMVQGNSGEIGGDLPSPIVPKHELVPQDSRFAIQPPPPEHIRKLADDATKDAQKNVIEPARGAQAARAPLNEMENLILSPGTSTNELAKTKMFVASWIYGIMSDNDMNSEQTRKAKEMVKKWTGLDLGDQKVFEKLSTTAGLTTARQLEGARQSLAGIQIALTTQPNVGNPKEANLKLVQLMKAANNYVIDKAKFYDEYRKKNNHYVGAEEAFAKERNVEQYTSQIMPYPIPRKGVEVNVRALKPYVTYEGQTRSGAVKKRQWVPDTSRLDGGQWREVE